MSGLDTTSPGTTRRGRVECGGTIVPPVEDVICEDCGEPGPADFESCWNCGSANGEGASGIDRSIRGGGPAGLFPWRLVLLGGMACSAWASSCPP